MERSDLLIGAICVLLLLYLPSKLSSISVVFDFNASLNDVAPVSPIKFTVDWMTMGKSELLMDTICVAPFVLTTQIEFHECCV